MSEKTLKFDNIRVNKKKNHKSKQPISLDLVIVEQVLISDKFKHSNDEKNLLVCLVFTQRYVDYRVFTLNI